MWKDKGGLLERFVKCVDGDFVIAEARTSAFTFLDADKTPFHRDVYSPIFYIFKACKTNPLRVSSSSPNHLYVYPVKDIGSHRTPAEVYADRNAYNLATFLFLPYKANKGDVGSKWDILFSSDDSFKVESSLEKSGVSLIYLSHGTSPDSSESIRKVSYVMPPQVLNHIFNWLNVPHEIHSHENSFDQKLEGQINIDLETARNLSFKLTELLEKRFRTKIMFENYKNTMSRRE